MSIELQEDHSPEDRLGEEASSRGVSHGVPDGTPPVGRAAVWRPHTIDGGREAGFLHLALWLIETHQPRLVIRLGLSEAQSFLAFRESAQIFGPGIECRAYALKRDPEWDGADHEDRLVSGRSDITRRDSVEALSAVDDGTIGLLSIDVALPEDALLEVAEQAWRKVSPDGVVVIAGISPGPGGQAARDALAIMGSERESWTVTDRNGRTASVLYATPARAPRHHFGVDVAAALSEALSRLGDGPVMQWTASMFKDDLGRAAAELEELTAARDERHEACATALFQLAGERDARSHLETEVRELRGADSRAKSERLRRFTETAALASRLMKFEEDSEPLRSEVKKLKADVTRARRAHDAVLESTFWRATSPARRIVDSVRTVSRLRGRR